MSTTFDQALLALDDGRLRSCQSDGVRAHLSRLRRDGLATWAGVGEPVRLTDAGRARCLALRQAMSPPAHADTDTDTDEREGAKGK